MLLVFLKERILKQTKLQKTIGKQITSLARTRRTFLIEKAG